MMLELRALPHKLEEVLGDSTSYTPVPSTGRHASRPQPETLFFRQPLFVHENNIDDVAHYSLFTGEILYYISVLARI